MAGESTLAAFSSDLAEAASAEYLLLLNDRASLAELPTLVYAGSINGSLSNVIAVPHMGLAGYDLPASTAEASSASATAFSDGKTTVTVAKYTVMHQPTDIVKMAYNRIMNPRALALNAMMAGANRITDLICNVIDGFTATASPGAGVDLDVPSLLVGIGTMDTLNVDLSFGASGVLHGQQWSDLYVDFSAVGGAIPFTPGVTGLLELRGTGYKGRWLGVDWHSSNRVVASGGDRYGAIWARGGVVWADGDYGDVAEDPANQIVMGGKVLFERSRLAEGGQTKYVTHLSYGVSKGLEAGVTIISDQ